MKKTYLLTFLFILLVVPLHASATTMPFTATLSGLNEAPPNASPATGFADILFDDATLNLSWDMTFSGLIAPATAAHFHGPALPGVNAGVLVPISGVAGLSSGVVSGSAILSATQANYLLDGLIYLNIHTSVFPGGEIRGQVQEASVPEPSMILILGSGFAGLAVFRKKFRKK